MQELLAVRAAVDLTVRRVRADLALRVMIHARMRLLNTRSESGG